MSNIGQYSKCFLTIFSFSRGKRIIQPVERICWFWVLYVLVSKTERNLEYTELQKYYIFLISISKLQN